MPTPINHLVMAQELVASGQLETAAQQQLEQAYGAFLLGHTAPDVQTVSQQPREETHFYTIPPNGKMPAYRALLAAHPQLACADRLEPRHAAFIAGYLSHLLADETWWRDIFSPSFGLQARWRTWKERLFFHNVLRTYLDLQDQGHLEPNAWRALAASQPQGWLPFVSDQALQAWRDLLVHQLEPGQHVRTAEVFAARMHVPAEDINSVLNSAQQMAQLFHHIPHSRLNIYRTTVLQQSAILINQYLQRQGDKVK